MQQEVFLYKMALKDLEGSPSDTGRNPVKAEAMSAGTTYSLHA